MVDETSSGKIKRAQTCRWRSTITTITTIIIITATAAMGPIVVKCRTVAGTIITTIITTTITITIEVAPA